MAAVALAYGVLLQRSLWYPINVLAAVAMPSMARADVPELRAFNATAVVLGVVAHGIVSILVGLLYATILPMLPRRHTLWGGLIAPLLWTGFLWALLALRNPVLAARVDWSWFVVSQIAFGLVAGFVVRAQRRSRPCRPGRSRCGPACMLPSSRARGSERFRTRPSSPAWCSERPSPSPRVTRCRGSRSPVLTTSFPHRSSLSTRSTLATARAATESTVSSGPRAAQRPGLPGARSPRAAAAGDRQRVCQARCSRPLREAPAAI